MSPEDAVQHVARLVTANPEFTEDGVYSSMATAGAPDRDADLAYKFTQAAWGRLLLDGMGITFAPDYHCLDGNGNVIESGKLSEQPHFIAATRLGERYGTEAGFKRLAATSAEFDAVNRALNAGSQPEKLVSAPLVLFLEPPTEAGMAKAQRFLSELLSRRRSEQAPAAETGAAGKESWLRKLFGRGPAR